MKLTIATIIISVLGINVMLYKIGYADGHIRGQREGWCSAQPAYVRC